MDGGRLAGVRRRARADPRLAPAPDGHVARRHGRGGGEPRRRAPAALGERLASRPEVDRYRPATAGLDEGRRREEAAQLRGAGVRLEPARGAGHRLRQLGRDGEQDGEPGPGDLGRVDDVAVVRLEDALERAADGAGGGPSEDEREQRGQLGVGQRERVVEAPGQVPDRDRRVLARSRDRGDRDRELADAVGAERVAEVDQRAWRQPARGVAPAEDVVARDVAVDDLHPQAVAHAGEAGVVDRHGALHQGPARGVADVLEQPVDHGAGAAHVPLEHAVGGRVLEAGERGGEPSGHRSHRAAGLRGEVRRLAQRRPLEVGQEPHVDPRARALDGHDPAPVARGEGHGGREAEAGAGDVRHRGVLELERGAPEARVGDLEHRAAAVACRDEEVAVLVAGELGRVAREPEVLERDLARVAGAEARRDDGVSLEGAAHRPVNHAAMTSRSSYGRPASSSARACSSRRRASPTCATASSR